MLFFLININFIFFICIKLWVIYYSFYNITFIIKLYIYEILLSWHPIFFWFILFMSFILKILLYIILKKQINIYISLFLQINYIIIYLILFFLFLIEDLLLFILLFESLIIYIIIISISYSYTIKLINSIFYTLFFSSISNILALFSIIFYWTFFSSQLFPMLSIILEHNNLYLLLYLWLSNLYIFSIKIPIFPFIFWLLYLHVEVSAESSILLAAILLKSGFLGILKFCIIFFWDIHIQITPLFTTFIIIGALYSTLSILIILDFKKIVAFWSILHINISIILVWLNNCISYIIFLLSNLNHIITASSYFFMLSILYDIYNSKNIMLLSPNITTSLFSFFLLLLFLNNTDYPFFFLFFIELHTVVLTKTMSFYILILINYFTLCTFISTLLLLLVTTYNVIKWSNFYIKIELSTIDILNITFFLYLSNIFYWFQITI